MKNSFLIPFATKIPNKISVRIMTYVVSITERLAKKSITTFLLFNLSRSRITEKKRCTAIYFCLTKIHTLYCVLVKSSRT